MIDEAHSQYKEKRRSNRFIGSIPVTFQILSKERNTEKGFELQGGYAENISRLGLSLVAEDLDEAVITHLRQKQKPIKLELEVSADEKISAEASVIWFHQAGKATEDNHLIGLTFTDISDRDRKLLLSNAKKQTKLFNALTVGFAALFLVFLVYLIL